MQAKSIYAVGVMSGTSQDGLDMCLAKFEKTPIQWDFEIIKAVTVEYTDQTKNDLNRCKDFSGEQLWKFHCDYGKWIGQMVAHFTHELDLPIELIGSHGHTVFHNPSAAYTLQIGHGAYIAAETGIPCICDFRSGDVARGGQGAPLVPIGDSLLFPHYDFCLNLGGIANISFQRNGQRIAYDICPANMALNHLANRWGLPMDSDGHLGRKGAVNEQLIETLNRLNYYSQKGAKSLGREWFEQEFIPIINTTKLNNEDILRTIYEHVADQIAQSTQEKPNSSMLVTGGGAKNSFLMELISKKCGGNVMIPSTDIVDFKEALIFAFLAVLYKTQTISSLSSVTGASTDSIGGCLYF